MVSVMPPMRVLINQGHIQSQYGDGEARYTEKQLAVVEVRDHFWKQLAEPGTGVQIAVRTLYFLPSATGR